MHHFFKFAPLASVFFFSSSFAEPVSTPETCKKIDFDSYFVAQAAKGNIQTLNPEVSHPNFASHYLLLRNERMMETLYLIVECRTGKILHEKISGEVQFTLQSPVVTVVHKDHEREKLSWDGETWVKIEELKSVEDPAAEKHQAVSPAQPASDIFAQSQANEESIACAPINFDSNFRAQRVKGSILKSNPKLAHPNFAGKYLMIQSEHLFDTENLVVDCATGKFLTLDSLVGKAEFRVSSTLVRLKKSGDFSTFFVFHPSGWIQIPDPEGISKSPIKNLLYGQDAALLSKRLPNPGHLSIVRFETLNRSAENEAVFQLLKAKKINQGKCTQDAQGLRCEVESE